MSVETYRSYIRRYGSGPYPSPDGIRMTIELVGGDRYQREHAGRIFYKFLEGFFCIVDPANGGHPVVEIDRGMIRRIEIEAL